MKKSFPKRVFLNSEWKNAEEAKISVFDRGFVFGDGLYEVIPFYNGKFFLKEDHLNRLSYGLKEINIEFDVDGINDVLLKAIREADLDGSDGAAYIQVTRGVAPRIHSYPSESKPTVLIYAFPVVLEGFEEKSVDVLVSEDYRWHRCDIKSTSLVANVAMNNEAVKNGFHENVLHRNGVITEGSHSSVFFVRNKVVYTHPNGKFILPGITRKATIDLCRANNIQIIETPLSIDQLSTVDEVFLTGTRTQILAVRSVVMNGVARFKQNQIGEITRILQQELIGKTRRYI